MEESGELDDKPYDRIDVSLLRTEAHLGVGCLSEARDWLQCGLADVDAYTSSTIVLMRRELRHRF